MAPAGNLLELRNVSRHISMGPQCLSVVKNVNLDVAAGQSVAIVGESGSGKSSLLEIIGTLNRASTGQVLFKGRDLASLSAHARLTLRRDRIGFVFQSAHLINHISTLDNVALPLRYCGVGKHQRRKRALYWLDRVGLADLASRMASRLSGGERQRVALARALVNEPELILADEPTGSLDHATGQTILNLMAACVDEQRSLVVVTHNLSQTVFFDRVVRMSAGELEEVSHAPAAGSA